jgi:SAM-dependent methyltransferase
MKKNTFGLEIPSRQEVLTNKHCQRYIAYALDNYLEALGVSGKKRPGIIEQILKTGKTISDDYIFEETINQLLSGIVLYQKMEQSLEERAKRISDQISPYLKSGASLDYGCGDGKVGRLIKEKHNFSVTLTDIFKHPSIDNYINLPFVFLGEHTKPSLPDDFFTNVILCTVLHHSDEPLTTLSNSIRITCHGGIIVFIESVYGVTHELAAESPSDPRTDAFLALSSKNQLAVNVFFDHFYNRCIHFSTDPARKVNVPFNYLTAEEWNRFFEKHGLSVSTVVPLGIDQPLAPLFHTLHVTVKP